MLISLKDIRNLCLKRIAMLDKQGYAVSGLKERCETIPESYDALLAFAQELNQVPKRPDFPYVEPDDLQGILAQRPENRQDTISGFRSEQEIEDKIAGGVIGRMIGCVLGKPMEVGWGLKQIRQYLEGVNAWPLSDYVPPVSPTQPWPMRRDCVDSMKGFIRHVQEDDDINYLVLGLKVLEQFGPHFTTQDMALLWRENIPYGWNWGAEHSRYYLLCGMWIDHNAKLPTGAAWDEVESFLNDSEELIGAMIRSDSFGLVNPGRPAVAADMAWRDGRLTHGKTGLYAEMWVAATVAAAFHLDDPVKVIEQGIAQLPQNSRYSEALRESLEWAVSEPDWYKVWEKIDAKWGSLGLAGTVNESAAIINALVHSRNADGTIDFEKAICITVMQGWDTDCSGATVGCIAGVMCGRNQIPEKWSAPLNDTFYTCVATERETKISVFSQRMYAMSRLVRAAIKT